MKTFSTYITELSKPAEIDTFRKTVSSVTSVDNRNTSWTTTLPALMKKYGFSILGSGKYASVFGNPKYPYVLKIFMKDSAYLKWIAFAQKNKDNPYVPKVRGKVLKITPVIFAIRLEKLGSSTGNKSGGSGDVFYGEYAKWQKDTSYVPADKYLVPIFKYFKENKALLDIHDENVMYRGDQLVIIDPFYNWFGKTKPGQFTIDPNDVDPSVF